MASQSTTVMPMLYGCALQRQYSSTSHQQIYGCLPFVQKREYVSR